MAFPDYPFEDHFADLGGLRMHYVDEGPRDGPPVVMVHGNPTWSFYFRRLISSLADQYRVIAPDHIGMGLSDKPGDRDYDHTLSRRIDDLTALIDGLQLDEPITLVVHDWGGMIGMGYAVRRFDHVGRIVVLNTAAFHLPPGKRFPWQLGLIRLPGLGALMVRGWNGFCRSAARWCAVRKPLPAEVRRAYLAPYGSWHDRLAVLRFVQDIPLRPGDGAYDVVGDIESDLDRFRTKPALICWGMRDFIFDAAFLDRWRQYWPHAEVHSYADAGHYVLEDAGEEITTTVRRFLDQSAPAADDERRHP